MEILRAARRIRPNSGRYPRCYRYACRSGAGPLEGNLDGLDGNSITGWAFEPARPDVPVTLEVLDGDGLIAHVASGANGRLWWASTCRAMAERMGPMRCWPI